MKINSVFSSVTHITLFSLLIIVAALQLYYIGGLNKKVTALEVQHIKIHESLNTLARKQDDILGSLAETKVQHQKSLLNHERAQILIDGIEYQTEMLRESLAINSQGNTNRDQKVAFTLLHINQLLNAKPSQQKPLPFSYFSSSEWKGKVAFYIHETNENGLDRQLVIDAGVGNDSVEMGTNLLHSIDGITFTNVENYIFKNGVPNIVLVYAPAFTNDSKDTLVINTDPEIDSLILDGCLAWSREKKNIDGYAAWVASDGFEKRRLHVTNDTQVWVADTCDTRYLLLHNSSYVDALWSGPQITGAGLKISFGGIGAALRSADGRTFVSYLEKGSPAEASGLKPGDEILEIDGMDISLWPLKQVIGQIRGKTGTPVLIKYRPIEDRDIIKNISIERKTIEIKG